MITLIVATFFVGLVVFNFVNEVSESHKRK